MKSHGWAVMTQYTKDGIFLLDRNVFPTKKEAELMVKRYKRISIGAPFVVKSVKIVY